jgi:hypothetical protein
MTERPLDPSATAPLGLTLCELRRRQPFATLPRGSWLAFVAIACHWDADARSWPSQTALARFSGYSCRALRRAVADLELRGLVDVREQPIATRKHRIEYAPGRAALAVAAGMAANVDPRAAGMSDSYAPAAEMADDDGARTSEISDNCLVAAKAAAPYRPKGPPLIKKKNPLLLLETTHPDASTTQSDGRGEDARPCPQPITNEDRDVARTALAECFRRQHPDRVPPLVFDPADIEQVAFCAAAIDGDAQSKLEALQDSLAGALRTSKGAPPTVRYIWGRIEHFLRHAERGRRIRRATTSPAQAPAEPCTPDDKATPPQPRLSRAQMATDLERLFGPTWRVRP